MPYSTNNASPPPFTPTYIRSPRYVDQPVTWRTRLFGMGGTTMIALLIAFFALFSWTTWQASKEPSRLSVFDVAPPASPPEPPSEIPPGPEQVQKEKDRPILDLPKIDPPRIQLPNLNAVPVPVVRPIPDPGPPVKDTTTPEVQPAPPAPQVSAGKPTWEGLVLGALNKAKRYPRDASYRRQQGVPWIRFVMNREGKVLSSQLERSSGFPALDNEAVALPRRAAPLPKPPEDVKGDTIELVVPVEFFMR